MILNALNNPLSRFYVSWDGHAESPYKVIERHTGEIKKEFSIYETHKPLTAAMNHATALEIEENDKNETKNL